MNQRFGGGRQPTGTPSLAWSCAVVIVSLLAGASIVHNIFKPDLICKCCTTDNLGEEEGSTVSWEGEAMARGGRFWLGLVGHGWKGGREGE
ncbi:hypothetical protein Acr_00g0018160 [Actinidia rufa]|uniref:Uncharacterized protein n=1 Tax=Actinidia rufa TaxID=165716 RepID=A0A7J0DBD6_9ERIC|nr:hypothetical protein Acr_00g0018160 [Actinidia rufa]